MLTLFIGGPADGLRIDVDPKAKLVEYPVNSKTPSLVSYDPNPPFEPETYSKVIYRRECINAGTKRIYFMVPLTVDLEVWIEQLVEGYCGGSDR